MRHQHELLKAVVSQDRAYLIAHSLPPQCYTRNAGRDSQDLNRKNADITVFSRTVLVDLFEELHVRVQSDTDAM